MATCRPSPPHKVCQLTFPIPKVNTAGLPASQVLIGMGGHACQIHSTAPGTESCEPLFLEPMTPVPAGGTCWMCHQQSLESSGCSVVPGMSHLAKHLKASTWHQKASERQQLPRNWLLGPAQTPFSRWCSCPHPAQDQDSPLCRMRTLCGIWFWEHCLVYSLARDLQGRFAGA